MMYLKLPMRNRFAVLIILLAAATSLADGPTTRPDGDGAAPGPRRSARPRRRS